MNKKTIAFAVVLILIAITFLAITLNKKTNVIGNSVKNNIKVTFYHSPTCGCCENYEEYLESKGFELKEIESDVKLEEIKQRLGIPTNMQSCHTAIIGKYFIEGHVPVEAISIITKNCEVCRDIGTVISLLKENGIIFERIRAVEYGSEEANELISKYNLTKVPALLLSEDIDAYSIAQQLVQQLKKENGYYVIESSAPYINTSNGKLRGPIELIMLYDSTCNICYNVSLHKDILVRAGMYIEKENIIDINSNEGKEIIEKYNITQIPTILLKGDINAYEGFNQVWQQVGSIEEDGTYVFRNLSALGKVIYKDLSKGEIING